VTVLMTTDTVGGTWTYALELVNALASRGVEVVLAAIGRPSRDQLDEVASSRLAGFHAADYRLEWMEDPWDDVDEAGEWLLELADELEPTLVHLNGYAHVALPWKAPAVVVGHSDVLSWHEAVRGAPAGEEWSRYRSLVEAGLAAADLLVAPTRALLDALVRLYEPSCPRLVVPNGVSSAAAARSKREVVLAAGRVWDEAKNLQALVRIAPRLSWPVAIAGEGDPGPGVERPGRLPRQELAERLAEAAVFAAPAFYEPFGLAALEAGCAGCALVLGDIPTLREVWDDAALFVPPADDEALVEALGRMIDDRRLREDYAARARRKACGYTAGRMASGYAMVYERAVAREGVRSG
jgi:glycogen synthase